MEMISKKISSSFAAVIEDVWCVFSYFYGKDYLCIPKMIWKMFVVCVLGNHYFFVTLRMFCDVRSEQSFYADESWCASLTVKGN